MQTLSQAETKIISGAYYAYVTPEWKERECFMTGIVFGVVGALIGGSLAVNTIAGVAVGGAIGYLFGYGLTSLEVSTYRNHTWYYFPETETTYYYYY